MCNRQTKILGVVERSSSIHKRSHRKEPVGSTIKEVTSEGARVTVNIGNSVVSTGVGGVGSNPGEFLLRALLGEKIEYRERRVAHLSSAGIHVHPLKDANRCADKINGG